MLNKLKNIHPFPAKMASEIAFLEIEDLPPGSKVLDPMVGSGTVLQVCSQLGHMGMGFDIDPLAVLMSKVATLNIKPNYVYDAALSTLRKAQQANNINLQWIDDDVETSNFIDFWFGPIQINQLRKLSSVLMHEQGLVNDILRVALSKTIITKSGGASLARDTSHSRPHKVKTTNDYDVFFGFIRAVEGLAAQISLTEQKGSCKVAIGDCRKLDSICSNSIDAVITSPPYFNAIDYLRGHKLALVWLGYSLKQVRSIRANSIGSYHIHLPEHEEIRVKDALYKTGIVMKHSKPLENQILRFTFDLYSMLKEVNRILRVGGKIVFVIGDSFHKGEVVSNSSIVVNLAKEVGFNEIKSYERLIPSNRRYLPPPSDKENSNLALRMKKEYVLVFNKTGLSYNFK